jgi:hypothetical protein
MPFPDRNCLLQSLYEARLKIEELLPKVDHQKEIYPGWTIREMLAHLTGWDDVTIDSLRAHVAGRIPEMPALQGVDENNKRILTSLQNMDLAHVIKEWRLTRQVLRTVIEKMPEEEFFSPVIVP